MATRRDFILGSAALAAAAPVAVTQVAAIEAPPSNSGGTPPHLRPGPVSAEDLNITSATIAEAEKLAGVSYTDDERGLMLETVGRMVSRAKRRRQVDLPEGLAPAVTFDPRLPGMAPPDQGAFAPARVRAGPVPDAQEDIAFAPVTRLAAWIKAGKLTSTRLTGIYLDRMKIWAGADKLNCVTIILEQQALAQAAAADREIAAGKYRGPLHGIPYGAKDLFDTAGVETAWGAAPYRGRVPQADAVVIRRLAEAGAVLLAKTTLGALAYADRWYGGQTRNPWNLAEGSSGSSAGSASSVAAGLVGFALGTETLGSIVAPSMRCGVTGLRPTFGRVARTGAMTLCWSLDKIGPLCRTVEDTALVLAALNGADPGDADSIDIPFGFEGGRGVKGLRVGYDPAWFEGERVTPVDHAGLAALKRTGVELVKVALPALPYETLLTILDAEAAAAFEELTLSGRDDELGLQGARDHPNSFRQARFVSAVDFVQAQRLRRRVMEVMDRAFTGIDAMISPSSGPPLLIITNYTGHPSLTLRTGFLRRAARLAPGDDPELGPGKAPEEDLRDVPHAVTLWGRLYEEGKLINIAMALEAELEVWSRRPPLV